MKKHLLVLAASGVVLASGAAFAHHGWGSYDASKMVIIESAITRVEWQNPHVHLDVNHANAKWELVLAPPFRMDARGLKPEMIATGTRVRVEGYASTRVEHELRAERITVDGKTFELR
jgi:hypothetical protein